MKDFAIVLYILWQYQNQYTILVGNLLRGNNCNCVTSVNVFKMQCFHISPNNYVFDMVFFDFCVCHALFEMKGPFFCVTFKPTPQHTILLYIYIIHFICFFHRLTN